MPSPLENEDDPEIAHVDLYDGIATLVDGTIVPIVAMFDMDGDQTNDPELACSYSAKDDNHFFILPVMEWDLER